MNKAEDAHQALQLRGIEQSLPLALLQAREVAMAKFRPMLRKHDLTEQQWRVIRVLAAFADIDASEIVKRSFLLAPSLTRILQYLESQNLVKRLSDSSDMRRAYFSLTVKGKRLYQRVAPDSERIYQQIAANYGQKKLTSLYELLAEFVALNEDSPEDRLSTQHASPNSQTEEI